MSQDQRNPFTRAVELYDAETSSKTIKFFVLRSESGSEPDPHQPETDR